MKTVTAPVKLIFFIAIVCILMALLSCRTVHIDQTSITTKKDTAAIALTDSAGKKNDLTVHVQENNDSISTETIIHFNPPLKIADRNQDSGSAKTPVDPDAYIPWINNEVTVNKDGSVTYKGNISSVTTKTKSNSQSKDSLSHSITDTSSKHTDTRVQASNTEQITKRKKDVKGTSFAGTIVLVCGLLLLLVIVIIIVKRWMRKAV